MKIKVAIANPRKHAKGDLLLSWLTLPASNEMIEKTFKDIGADNKEYVILDYEAPFKINKHDSVVNINMTVRTINDIELSKNNGSLDPEKVISLAFEMYSISLIDDAFEYADMIIHDDYVNEMIKSILTSGDGWRRISNLLGNADPSKDYHFLNGDRNLELLSLDKLNSIYNDILDEAKSNFTSL